MPLHVAADERLDGGRHGQREQRAHGPDQGDPDDDRAERHGRLQLHRALGQRRRQEVVLDLLVDHREADDDQRLARAHRQRDEGGQGRTDVRANGRDELPDDADEEPERDGIRDAGDGEDHRMSRS